MNNDFVFVDEFVPGIRWDAKYATWDNFTGKPVDGYHANRIVGTRALCAALDRARERAAADGFGLLLWDGYRPQRAVDCFLRWSRQPEDGRTKPRHYPNIDRPEMFEQGYVAAKSGHSRGATVDLTLFDLSSDELAPMGGDHDLMDPVSPSHCSSNHRGRSEKPSPPALRHGSLRFRFLRSRMVALHPEPRAVPTQLLRFPHQVGGQLHGDAEPARGPGSEGEGPVVCLCDALDDCEPEADTCMVGSYAFSAATKRFDQCAHQLWGELLARVLDSERHTLGVTIGLDPYGALVREVVDDRVVHEVRRQLQQQRV
jgi:D-alanyl-D-alanine dipeptidase